jgi:hypothetical protein
MVNLINPGSISSINHFIAANPSGTLTLTDSLQMDGQLKTIIDSTTAAKNSLIQSQNNQVVCSSIENFKNNLRLTDKMIFLCFLIFLLIFLLIIYFTLS